MAMPKNTSLMAGLVEKHLTMRERQVLELLAEGCSMKEAARVLHITARTVAFHKYHTMDKFNLRGNAELIRFAIREGIIKAA